MRRFCFEAALRRFARAGRARRGGERARDGVLGVVSITRLARLRHPRSSRTREGRRRARLASALWPPLRSDRGSGARSDFLFKMLLIGDSGVGKSCLLLRFAVRCLPPCAPGALPASRRPATSPPTRRPRAARAGVQVRGGLPLDHRRGLCARRPAPRPAAAPRCGARSERGVLARATLRKSGPWRSTARRSSSSWCARPHHHRPRGRQRRAAGISAHGCRLLLRAAVGHCRAGALPDDHEQLLPREPGHHDRVRRDRPPVRALGAPCLAVVGCRR